MVERQYGYGNYGAEEAKSPKLYYILLVVSTTIRYDLHHLAVSRLKGELTLASRLIQRKIPVAPGSVVGRKPHSTSVYQETKHAVFRY